ATPQLNLTTTANTAVGTFIIAVTGTAAGGLVHSSNVTLTVSAATSVNILSISPEPSFVGQAYSIAYSVTSATGTPTGNVRVGDGTITNTCTVAAGACSLTSTAAGTKTVSVSYAGTAVFSPSGNAASHVVNKAPT